MQDTYPRTQHEFHRHTTTIICNVHCYNYYIARNEM